MYRSGEAEGQVLVSRTERSIIGRHTQEIENVREKTDREDDLMMIDDRQ